MEINMKRLLIGLNIFLMSIFLMNCSDDGPSSPNISDYSGTWTGSIMHPAYDGGSLEVDMLEEDEISGTYKMRLTEYIESNGRTFVQNIGGGIEEGQRNSRNSISFTLDVDGSLWDFRGTSESRDIISGNWEIRNRTGINGTFQISK
jgi:hypothetical protein